MAITNISRDWGSSPCIVRIISTDNIATITASGYLDDQANNIEQINSGPFEWVDSDLILINYSNTWAYFERDATNATFTPVIQSGDLHTRVSMTAVQLDAAYTTPYLLIAAPGTNLQIVVKTIRVFENYGGVVFASGGNIFAQYDSTTAGGGVPATGVISAASLIAAVANSGFQLTGTQAVANSAITNNKGLYLSNATGSFTGGTATVFTLDIWYSVVSYS